MLINIFFEHFFAPSKLFIVCSYMQTQTDKAQYILVVSFLQSVCGLCVISLKILLFQALQFINAGKQVGTVRWLIDNCGCNSRGSTFIVQQPHLHASGDREQENDQ